MSEDQKAQFNALEDGEEIAKAVESVKSPESENAQVSGASASSQAPKPSLAANGQQVLTQEDVQRAIDKDRQEQAERRRKIRGIALKAGKDDTWVDNHVESGKPIGEIALTTIETLERNVSAMETHSISIGQDLNHDTLNDAVSDAIMLRAGTHTLASFDNNGMVILSNDRQVETRKPHERSNDFKNLSIIEMGKQYLLALGCRQVASMGRSALADLLMSRSQIQAIIHQAGGLYLAHATGDFPHILADVMGKQLRQEYALQQPTWPLWAQKGTAPDYKQIKRLQLGEAANLTLKPEGDEITYGTLTESREVWALSTYATGIKYTREMMVNDDLSAFLRLPRKLMNTCRRKEETLAIAVLTDNSAMADGNSLFSTAHANLITGALTVSSLGAARKALRSQTALGSDDPLELTPRILLVPETISVTAEQLVASTVDPAKSNSTPNPFANKLQVVSSPRLDSTSTTQWYMMADSSQIDTVEIGFLEGEEAPRVQEEDEFDSSSRKVKVEHDLAAKAIDWRGMVRSSGS